MVDEIRRHEHAPELWAFIAELESNPGGDGLFLLAAHRRRLEKTEIYDTSIGYDIYCCAQSQTLEIYVWAVVKTSDLVVSVKNTRVLWRLVKRIARHTLSREDNR